MIDKPGKTIKTPSLDPYADLASHEDAASDAIQQSISDKVIHAAAADDAAWRKRRASIRPVARRRAPRRLQQSNPSPDAQ